MKLKEFRLSNFSDFVVNYEIVLIGQIHSLEWKQLGNVYKYERNEKINYEQFEIDFIVELHKYIFRLNEVLNKYLIHCIATGKYKPEERYIRIFGNNNIGTLNSKLIFLHRKLQKLGVNIKLKTLQLQSDKLFNERENELIDLSTTKGTEKIIYLEKLGILNYLKDLEPFRSSTNSLATVISAITGIPQTTAQSYINPISNTTIDQKNNPLNSTKKVEKIEHTLLKLGFKPLQ